MGQSGKDLFKLKSDWLSVDEVVEAVTSPSCGAISVFIGESVFTSAWKCLQWLKSVNKLYTVVILWSRFFFLPSPQLGLKI